MAGHPAPHEGLGGCTALSGRDTRYPMQCGRAHIVGLGGFSLILCLASVLAGAL